MTAELEATKPAGGALLRGLRVVWELVRDFFGHVVAEPYREGRLRAKAWPTGLRTIVVIAVSGYALAVLGILFAGPLRESLELSVSTGAVTLSFPRPVLWVLVMLVALSVALLQTAALHVSWWLAISITALSGLVLVFLGGMDSGGLFSPGRLVTVVAWLGLIALLVARHRRRFAWWEFAVVLSVVGLSFAVASYRAMLLSAPAGIDPGPTSLSLTMTMIGQLAVPAAIAAGAAVAELSASTALWAVGVVRRRLPRVLFLIGVGILVLWRLGVLGGMALGADGPTPAQLLSSLLLTVVLVGCWMLLARLRPTAAARPTALRLVDRLGDVATPIAAGLAATLAPIIALTLVMQILFAYGVGADSLGWMSLLVGLLSTSTAVGIVRLAVGLVLVVVGLVLARRGTRTTPELVTAIGVVTITVACASLLGLGSWLWTSQGLTTVATIGCLALLAWYGIRRRLSDRRLTGLAVALLLAAFFDQRDFVSDPLGALLGFTGVAFVLFGFVWSFLTSGGYANEGSAAYPRPARVLLFLANSVFGVTVLAFTALARDPEASINLGAFAEIGDQLFGTGLLAAALLVVLWAVLVDGSVGIVGRKKPVGAPAPAEQPTTTETVGSP